MRSVIVLIYGLWLVGTSSAQNSVSTIFSCEEMLETHEFTGTCCVVSDTPSGGGCILEVPTGTCEPSGPVWFEPITSSSDDNGPCPPGDYPVLEESGIDPTLAPITADPTSGPTPIPTQAPAPDPTPAPVTSVPVPDPTSAPVTSDPTSSPTTGSTSSPTTRQTSAPTASLMTTNPSSSPINTVTTPPTVAASTTPTTDERATTSIPTTTRLSETPSMSPSSQSSSNLPLSEEPSSLNRCQNDEDCPVCSLGCEPEFCGTDGNCYTYTCPNFFRYHRISEYDNVTESGDTELTCLAITSEETDVHVSNYGCDIVVGELPLSDDGVGMKPNRMCSGISKDDGVDLITVTCYDIDDDTNVDYDSYSSAADSTNAACNDVGPFFYYSASYLLDDVRTAFTVSDTAVFARASVDLDPVKVAESMHAHVYKDTVSTEPSMIPSETPTEVISSSPSSEMTTSEPQIPSVMPFSNDNADMDLPPDLAGCQNNTQCPEKFCGTDGNCYDYTCNNFFRWNPVTTFDGSGDLELSCESRTTAIDIINYGCSRTVGTTTLDDGVGLQSNQRCIGRSRDEEELVTVECYNLADGTDFTDFIAESQDLVEFCVDGQVPLPRYFYGVGYTLSEFKDGRFQSTTNIENGPLRTETFNATKALKAMFAVVVTEPVTADPTRMPTSTPPPTPDSTLKDIESVASPRTKTTSWTSLAISVMLTSALWVLGTP